MTRYVLGRLAMVPIVMLVVTLLTFGLLHLAPGDAVDSLGGFSEGMDEAQREALREEMGLNDPFLVQYGSWLTDALRGDLGTSSITRQPVMDELIDRSGVSIELAVCAIALALGIGVALGGVASRWRDSGVDRGIMLVSTVGMSLPSFFAGTLIVLLLSLYVPSIGVVSYVHLSESILGSLKSLFFPALSIAIVAGCTFSRYVRGTAEDISRHADYIRTAQAKGASKNRVLFRHLLPNALVPLFTVAGIQFGYLIGGTVIVETIFALPGVGRMIMAGVTQRDYPVVMGGVLLLAFAFVVINLLVDLLYPLLDPRVRARGRTTI